LGDPAGISYECLVKAASAFRSDRAYVLYGEEVVLRYAIERFNPSFTYERIGDASEATRPGVYLISLDRVRGVLGIRPSEAAGFVAVTYLGRVAADVLRGLFDAVVTMPISKFWAQKGGKFSFPGQTEFFAFFQRSEEFAMAFYSEPLKVVLQTAHEPLKRVPELLTREGIVGKLLLIDREWKRYFGFKPRVGVLGLNPHAGEGGQIGKEEAEVIAPAVRAAKEAGVNAEGPLVPDTAFLKEARERYDVFLAMYHDQGLIPFKMLAFEEGVNFTLGLPVPRTSPDHGTAFDIAWKGLCNPRSTREAVKLADLLAEHSRKEELVKLAKER